MNPRKSISRDLADLQKKADEKNKRHLCELGPLDQHVKAAQHVKETKAYLDHKHPVDIVAAWMCEGIKKDFVKTKADEKQRKNSGKKRFELLEISLTQAASFRINVRILTRELFHASVL